MKQPTTSELRIYPDEVDNTAMALDFLSEVRPELRLSLLFSFINQARLEADKRHLGRIAAVMLGTEDQLRQRVTRPTDKEITTSVALDRTAYAYGLRPQQAEALRREYTVYSTLLATVAFDQMPQIWQDAVRDGKSIAADKPNIPSQGGPDPSEMDY